MTFTLDIRTLQVPVSAREFTPLRFGIPEDNDRTSCESSDYLSSVYLLTKSAIKVALDERKKVDSPHTVSHEHNRGKSWIWLSTKPALTQSVITVEALTQMPGQVHVKVGTYINEPLPFYILGHFNRIWEDTIWDSELLMRDSVLREQHTESLKNAVDNTLTDFENREIICFQHKIRK